MEHLTKKIQILGSLVPNLDDVTTNIQNVKDKVTAIEEQIDAINDKIGDDSNIGGEVVQSDWNETDETSNAYIKNRPFYEIPEEVAIVSDYTFTDSDEFSESIMTSGLHAGLTEYNIIYNQDTNPEAYANLLRTPLVVDAYYRITIDDEVYLIQAYKEGSSTYLDGYYTGIMDPYCPFGITWRESYNTFRFQYYGEQRPSHLRIEQIVSDPIVSTLDDKFIPGTIARISDVTNLSAKVDELSSEAYQSDWLEDNAASSTYIKNRPFYESKKMITAIDYQFAEDDSFSVNTTTDVEEFFGQPYYSLRYEAMVNSDKFNSILKNDLVTGADYIVTIDDKVYMLTSTSNVVNTYLAGSDLEPPLPFYITRGTSRGGNILLTFYGSKPSYLKVEQITDEVELVQIDEKFIPDTIARKSDITNAGSNGGSTQPDWNQNDESANDHIKNRPFYKEASYATILDNLDCENTDYYHYEFSTSNGDAWYGFSELFYDSNTGRLTYGIDLSKTYRVIFDGVEYNLTPKADEYGDVYIGNTEVVTGTYSEDDADIPFAVSSVYYDNNLDNTQLMVKKTTAPIITLMESQIAYHKLSTDYLPTDELRSDWNQNDPTAPNYIENRPFYNNTPAVVAIVYDGTILGSDLVTNGTGWYYLPYDNQPIANAPMTQDKWYEVVLDGVTYYRQAYKPYYVNIGNQGDPFGVVYNGNVDISFSTPSDHTIKITEVAGPGGIVQLDEKFIPDTIARAEDIPIDSVSFAPQTLTDEQKAQARTNIGACKEPVIVTLSNYAAIETDDVNLTMHYNAMSSHSASEIIELYNNGYEVLVRYSPEGDSGILIPFLMDYAGAVFQLVWSFPMGNSLSETATYKMQVVISDDKTAITANTKLHFSIADGAGGVSEERVNELITQAFANIPTTSALNFANYEGGSFTETLSDGSTVTHNVTFDSNGTPTNIDGIEVSGV